MELTLLNKTDTHLEIEVKGENETLLNLLKQKLLENEKVVSATYVTRHHQLDFPRLVVDTQKGTKAEAALKAATKELRAAYADLEKQLAAAIGK